MMPTFRSLPLLACCISFLFALETAGAKKPPPKKPAAPAAAAAAAAPAPPLESTPPATPAVAPPNEAPATPTEAKPPAEDKPPAAPLAAAPAAADAKPATPTLTPEQLALAKQHFDAGTQAFEEKHYEVALNEFTTSFEISKEPDLLYNLHRVAIRLGQREMAVNYLRDYLRYRPEESAKVQPEIDQLNAQSPPPPAPVSTPPAPAGESVRGAPRWPGSALMVLGGASAVAGAAVLIATTSLPTDEATPTDRARGGALLGAGGFLVATGAVEFIAGLAIYLKRRPSAPARVALLPLGASLPSVGLTVANMRNP